MENYIEQYLEPPKLNNDTLTQILDLTRNFELTPQEYQLANLLWVPKDKIQAFLQRISTLNGESYVLPT